MLIILAQKYKYLNNFALIHLNHSYSTSKNYENNNIYYLSVLFCGNTLFDYHINIITICLKIILIKVKNYFQNYIIL